MIYIASAEQRWKNSRNKEELTHLPTGQQDLRDKQTFPRWDNPGKR